MNPMGQKVKKRIPGAVAPVQGLLKTDPFLLFGGNKKVSKSDSDVIHKQVGLRFLVKIGEVEMTKTVRDDSVTDKRNYTVRPWTKRTDLNC